MSEVPSETDFRVTGFTPAETDFIQKHLHADTNELILKSARFQDLDIRKLAGQILARQKASKKLPEWSALPALIFPQAVSVEQSSSEATARYKATHISGTKLIDITGGMGVDCYYLSRRFIETTYFEQQKEVAETASFNFKLLSAGNIHVRCANSLDYLKQNPSPADWIYADPARRGTEREKVVLLADCTPDILQHLPLLFANAPSVMLKTSPLLDIDLAVSQLAHVREVHIVGYEQECKELLFMLNRDATLDEVLIKSVILNGSGEVTSQLTFTRRQEYESVSRFSKPLAFLYEPHPALLKAGGFKMIGEHFKLCKLAVNSHLYTSGQLCTDFPGRSFKVVGVCKPDMKEIAGFIKGDKANLTTRNFPGKIHDLRKKWRLKEGGDFYLFATTLEDNSKVVVVTEKIKTAGRSATPPP